MLSLISEAKRRRSLRSIVFSVVFTLSLVFAAPNAIGSPSDSTDFKMVKFVIQPATGQIVIGKEGAADFHELLAADLDNVEATGFVKGEFMWSDGKPVGVNFNTEHIEGSDLNRKWTDGAHRSGQARPGCGRRDRGLRWHGRSPAEKGR